MRAFDLTRLLKTVEEHDSNFTISLSIQTSKYNNLRTSILHYALLYTAPRIQLVLTPFANALLMLYLSLVCLPV